MRAFAFLRSVLMLAVVGGAVPIALVVAGESRFGGASPLHGVPGPGRWSAGGMRALFAEPLTDRTLADVVIRVALVVAWTAVLVFVVTVVAETAHMLRHGGHHLPDVRGLRWSQRGARAVAAGLLALVPMVTHVSSAVAGDGGSPLLARPFLAVRIAPLALGQFAPETGPTQAAPSASPLAGYVVRAGDSVFGIASQLAGPDEHAVATYAERILDLNLGRDMPGGERFTNPGLIDVGWVLQLPHLEADPSGIATAAIGRHVVLEGETLWSIADDELGEATRWPELFDANAGETFADGRTLHDPALLQPGWDLIVPVDDVVLVDASASASVLTTEREDPAPVAVPAIDHDAHHLDGLAEPSAGHVPDLLAEAAAPASVDAGGDRARPENTWVRSDDAEPAAASSEDATTPQLLTIRRAGMLAAGVLTLVAVRRRRRLREASPRARLPQPSERVESTERELRAVGAGERLARVDLAVRAATLPLVDSGERLLAVLAGADGAIEIVATGPAELPEMWRGAADRWTLSPSVPLETIAAGARQVNAACPTLVQLGVADDGRDVYVDLEAIGVLEICGLPAHRDAIVVAIAATLAGSVLAEVTTLVSIDVPADAFLGHRLHVVADGVDQAFELAREAVGALSTMDQSPFELRARGTSGESWDPVVVLAGSGVGTVRVPSIRPGVAVVSASPIEGPSTTLIADGDAWLLRPIGLRLQPIGLVPDDISAIGDLARVAPAVLDERSTGSDELGDDCTIYVTDDSEPTVTAIDVDSQPDWDLKVRLFGPVEVVDRDGTRVSFERSKTTELVTWLATHRDRSTRANARTALWEQDVRDATFANVVSEARRGLARRVPPPEGEEWVGRTLTEALPLHPRVTTDADVLAWALSESRGRSPQRAIALLRGPVAAIAGLPFEGTSYLWPDGEGITSNLILLATSAAAELAAHCLAVGDTEGVFEATSRGLRVLPGHEELIGLRMRAHARAGDHAAVRQEWNSYERVVNADPWSDGEPSPKLVDLRKELLHPSV